jgi:DNA-binding NarL/FixJ family response regulator
MSGLDLCRRLRRDVPELKAILSSGSFLEREVRVDAAGGEIIYLPKPSPVSVLLETVRGCLDGFSSRGCAPFRVPSWQA